MSRENFDNNIWNVVTATVVQNDGNFSKTARELGVSRQTVRRIAQGDTQTVSKQSLDKIANNFQELPVYKQAKSLYGVEVVQLKVFETGNRRKALEDLNKNKKEFEKEIKRKQEEWKDLTKTQKIQRGYSPSALS